MPFKSEAQRRYLWMKHPELARRWAHEYGTPKDLPEHVKRGAIQRRLDKHKKRATP
ncbi:MAG: hypothetical protein AB1510_02170 [Bacillota bacterium]